MKHVLNVIYQPSQLIVPGSEPAHAAKRSGGQGG